MLNVDTISFLIGTFRQITSTFGQDSKSVAFFRQQVNSLINIGQVGVKEADIVFKVIGMQNTDAVKWDTANRKMEMFINCMNYMIETKTLNDKERILEILKSRGMISDSVANIVSEIYGIKEFNLPEVKNPKFATINTNKVEDEQSKIDKNLFTVYEILYNKLLILSKQNYYVEVKNVNAVCCSDPSKYTVDLASFLKRKKELSHIYSLLKKGAPYNIGKRFTDNGNPCRPVSYIVNDNELHTDLDNFDFSYFTELLMEKKK